MSNLFISYTPLEKEFIETSRRHDEAGLRQRRVDIGQRLAAQAESIVERFPQLSLLLAVEAAKYASHAGELHDPELDRLFFQAMAMAGGLVLGYDKGQVRELALTSDGCRLFAAGGDGVVRSWDLSAPNPVTTLIERTGHSQIVDALALSPDDRWLVSGSGDRYVFDASDMLSATAGDKTACCWDLSAPTDAGPMTLSDHRGGVLAVAISPDGRWLVTASEDATAQHDYGRCAKMTLFEWRGSSPGAT